MKKNKQTQTITSGRRKEWTHGSVNPPVQRASTILFDSVEEKKKATQNRTNQTLFYGRRGTQTHFAFQEAMALLEGGEGCALYPSGSAAITHTILAFVQTGDHILMVDTCYEPTRDFCENILRPLGISTTYYTPYIGQEIELLFQPNTKILFTESPGSITMELQDIPLLAKIAKQYEIIVMLDNTWSAGINFPALEYGVDISIQAATKYIIGHSDVMLGTAVANKKHWPKLREKSYLMGQCISADDAYLALRGLRTLNVRLAQHEKSSLTIARWLEKHPLVETVLHPALESFPKHSIFKRDFQGSNGLFSFVLKQANQDATNELLNHTKLFKMGYSWGGFESLILANEPESFKSLREIDTPPFQGTLIRLHIGLEDTDDLIKDLSQALLSYQEAL